MPRQIEGETVFKVHISPVDPTAGVMVCFENIQAAELLNQQRRNFVANVSHELRSPLTVMIGVLETLQGSAKSDPVAQETFLAVMAAEADWMRLLIKDLLARVKLQLKGSRPATTGAELWYGDLRMDTTAVGAMSLRENGGDGGGEEGKEGDMNGEWMLMLLLHRGRVVLRIGL